MKIALCLLATAILCHAADGVPASSNVRGAEYPRILPDMRVSFKVAAPTAQKVQIMPGGGANGLGKGPFDMTRNADGSWTATIGPVQPGFHYYWLLVDGVAANDPGSETYFGWGKQSSGIDVPEPALDFYEAKDVAHGDVHIHWYRSGTTGKMRRVSSTLRRDTTRIRGIDIRCCICSTAPARASAGGRCRGGPTSSSITWSRAGRLSR